jgi:hypothetical protein
MSVHLLDHRSPFEASPSLRHLTEYPPWVEWPRTRAKPRKAPPIAHTSLMEDRNRVIRADT